MDLGDDGSHARGTHATQQSPVAWLGKSGRPTRSREPGQGEQKTEVIGTGDCAGILLLFKGRDKAVKFRTLVCRIAVIVSLCTSVQSQA